MVAALPTLSVDVHILLRGLHLPRWWWSHICTSLKWGYRCTDILVRLPEVILLAGVVDVVLVEDSGPLCLPVGHRTQPESLLYEDVTGEGVLSSGYVLSMTFWISWILDWCSYRSKGILASFSLFWNGELQASWDCRETVSKTQHQQNKQKL